jgi:hypothetical protein
MVDDGNLILHKSGDNFGWEVFNIFFNQALKSSFKRGFQLGGCHKLFIVSSSALAA